MCHASQFEEGRGDGAHVFYDVHVAADESHVSGQLIQEKTSQNIWGGGGCGSQRLQFSSQEMSRNGVKNT